MVSFYVNKCRQIYWYLVDSCLYGIKTQKKREGKARPDRDISLMEPSLVKKWDWVLLWERWTGIIGPEGGSWWWDVRQLRKPFSPFQMAKAAWEKELTASCGETSRGNTTFKWFLLNYIKSLHSKTVRVSKLGTQRIGNAWFKFS